MWTSVKRILKPYQKLHVADLGPVDGEWVTEDAGKAAVLARRFFPSGPTSPYFQTRSTQRRQEVEDWLAEEWEEHLQSLPMRFNANSLRCELWLPQVLMGSWLNAYRRPGQ